MAIETIQNWTQREKRQKNMKSFSDLFYITQSNMDIIWGLKERVKEKYIDRINA